MVMPSSSPFERRRQDRRPPDQPERRRVRLSWYDSLNSDLQTGHEVELLINGEAFFPALVSAIEAARESVYLETYIFNDDPSGQRVATALSEAADRGVSVNCVVDGFGTPSLTGRTAELMANPRIRFETFRPERFRFFERMRVALDRQRLRRLHRKLVLIDDAEAFVGGINLLDDRIDPNHGELAAPRLDFAVRVRGPLVATVNLAMQRLLWELSVVNRSLRRPRPNGSPQDKGAPLGPMHPTRTRIASQGSMRAMLLVRDNLRHRRSIERWYLRAIGQSRREVLIANAYFLPGVRLRRALIKAVQRGVRVRLLLQGKVEYRLQHYATQALYDELLAQGVEIHEYERSFLHAKVAVIDAQATIGSSNIDPFSLLLAREANVVIDDQAFADALRGQLETAIADGSRELELHSHRRRPWPVRLMNWCSFVLLRLAVSITGHASRY